eukprot:CAMPEP_0198277092 /NCGR_PEP_ID=MMETSP1447-20131203/65664_1 /TAXON_ID=420782 /ORGANISM="Chaetoceros dichaeta, Strain CCMP1751" /LENGTH=425 /DNA_ID=CAMNT_0043972087 /DNA_START=14 /DNA_END=1291 /DNA_ORIENTATION=-
MTIPFSPVSPVLAADDDNGDISTVTTSTTITIPDPTPPDNTPTPTKPDPLSTDHITATWNSIDGLKTNDENKSENKFVSFDPSAYKAMKDDESRTPLFERAIQQRLQNAPDNIPASEQVVLDIGTGPFALFAITAAQAGAGKVYAIEANREAAKSARATVQQLGLTNTITILEGFSTEITLPTKADFVIAEIVGSIATEEGAYATILDAHERHVKKPEEGSSWIPSRIQTFAAPAGYTLHNMFSPPAFDWGKLKGEPVRFNCRDEALQILSDPVVVEDIEFKDVKRGVPRRLGGSTLTSQQISFVIDGERMNDNRVKFRDELRRGGLRKLELEQMTTKTGQTVSGIAMWPRILLDTEEQILINTRTYPKGDHQKSHWQTVLPIMSDEPVRVKDGDEVLVTVDFNVPDSVLSAPTYKLDGDILHYS